jgi:type IV secretory pathway VirB4 component
MALFGKKSKKKSDEIKLPQETGAMTIIDLLAPEALKLESNFIQLGDKFIKTLFILSYPRYLETNWLSPIINLDQFIDISLFFHPIDTGQILKQLRKKVAEVQAQIAERGDKGMVRDPILETAYQDLESLRDKLQQAREKLFRFGLYITIYANSKEELGKAEAEITSLLENRLVYPKPANFQHDVGFNATLPLGIDKIQVYNTLNTAPISTVFPFVSMDLTDDKGVLYGINRHNNSLVLFDRFSLENANMVIFAKSGAGKSYATKLEILRQLMMGVEMVVIDPENEYQYLAESTGGSYFKISLTSKTHLNPFDLPEPMEDEAPQDTFRSHIIEMVGLVRIMLGGLTPEEDAIIDQALSETYAVKNITPESDFSQIEPPTMTDLQLVLESMAGGQSLATRLKKYTTGSFRGFLTTQTNIALDTPLVVFSIRDLEKELWPVAMFVVIQFVWNIIRSELKKRVMIIDEAWWLLQHEDGGSFIYGIAKRGRKYFLGLTTITQDISDFLDSKYGKAIVSNSSLQLLMKQSPSNIDAIAKIFNLTQEERFILLEASVGEGIFFAGPNHVAVAVTASYAEDQIITSDPAQILAIEKAKQELAAEEAGIQKENATKELEPKENPE